MNNTMKRKCTETTTEEVLTLTYHRTTNLIECICGVQIGREHKCPTDIKAKNSLEVSLCDADNCETCIQWKKDQDKRKAFLDQWYEDEDGYMRCSECHIKCQDVMPKECECDWYVDENGISRCKECHGEWHEHEGGYMGCSGNDSDDDKPV